MDVPTLNPNLRASEALSLLFNRSAPKPHLFGFLATPPSPLCLRNGALFAGNNVAPAAEIIYIFSFLPSLLCHVQLVVAAEPVSEEERAKGGGGGWEREGEPAMGTRHADRYSGWARDAPPSALPLGGQAAPPPPHPVKRGGGEEGEGSDPAAAAEVGRVVSQVSWTGGLAPNQCTRKFSGQEREVVFDVNQKLEG